MKLGLGCADGVALFGADGAEALGAAEFNEGVCGCWLRPDAGRSDICEFDRDILLPCMWLLPYWPGVYCA